MECLISADWVVDASTLLNTEEIESKVVQTTIPGIEYSISICNDGGPDIGIYLCVKLDHDGYTINAAYTFSIPSENFSESKSYKFDCQEPSDEGIYWSQVEFFSPQKSYIKDGKLSLHLRGTFRCDDVGTKEYVPIGHSLWRKDDDKDFTIQVGDKEVKVHKFILRERSPVFAAMFNSGMKEAIENKVKIEGFPFYIVKEAIEFCYIPRRHSDHTEDSLLKSLKFSEIYDMSLLKTDTEYKIQKKLTPANVCRFANASIEFNANKLRLCCMNLMINCSKESTSVADFHSLDDAFKLELANQIMSHKI